MVRLELSSVEFACTYAQEDAALLHRSSQYCAQRAGNPIDPVIQDYYIRVAKEEQDGAAKMYADIRKSLGIE